MLPQELKGKTVKFTIVWKEQDKAVEMWKELEWNGFKFRGEWKYDKWDISFQVWYDDTLKKEFFREIKIEDKKQEKPKRKKRLKPAQKNKKK